VALIQQKNEELAELLEEENLRAKQEAEEQAQKEREVKEAQELEQKLREEQRRKDIYRQAVALGGRATKIGELDETVRLFHSLGNYLDAEKNAKQFRERALVAKRKMVVKILRIGVPAVVVCVIIVQILKYVNIHLIIPTRQYNEAVSEMKNGNYSLAQQRFEELGEFRDSPDMITETIYLAAKDLVNEGEYDQALSMFTELGDYKDSPDMINETRYLTAQYLLGEEEFTEAESMFTELGDYKDSQDMINEAKYQEVQKLYNDGAFDQAKLLLVELGDYKESIGIIDSINEAEYLDAQNLLSNGDYYQAKTILEKLSDYKDSAEVLHELQEKLDNMASKVALASRNAANIVQYTYARFNATVAIKSDGTVVATGNSENGILDVETWNDIIGVVVGATKLAGLKSDGTIIVNSAQKGEEAEESLRFYETHTDIVGLFQFNDYSNLLLKSDGRIVCDFTGFQPRFDAWTDIVAVSSDQGEVIGLKSDGTVVASADESSSFVDYLDEVNSWSDIVAVDYHDLKAVGLKSDGTVVAAGNNDYGECDVSEWTDIVAIYAGRNHTIGLKSDGSVVATGDNGAGQCDVSEWRDIVAVSTFVPDSPNGAYTVGLKSDGTVVATGNNSQGQCDVSEWTDIVAIFARYAYTIGLKSDGTAVAVGYNGDGRCDAINGWTGIRVEG
jgi:TolA-binding protein